MKMMFTAVLMIAFFLFGTANGDENSGGQVAIEPPTRLTWAGSLTTSLKVRVCDQKTCTTTTIASGNRVVYYGRTDKLIPIVRSMTFSECVLLAKTFNTQSPEKIKEILRFDSSIDAENISIERVYCAPSNSND